MKDNLNMMILSDLEESWILLLSKLEHSDNAKFMMTILSAMKVKNINKII